MYYSQEDYYVDMIKKKEKCIEEGSYYDVDFYVKLEEEFTKYLRLVNGRD